MTWRSVIGSSFSPNFIWLAGPGSADQRTEVHEILVLSYPSYKAQRFERSLTSMALYLIHFTPCTSLLDDCRAD